MQSEADYREEHMTMENTTDTKLPAIPPFAGPTRITEDIMRRAVQKLGKFPTHNYNRLYEAVLESLNANLPASRQAPPDMDGETLYKSDCFDYLCWLEETHQSENVKGCKYLVLASDGTTCWGHTYADAVKVAMHHDKELYDAWKHLTI